MRIEGFAFSADSKSIYASENTDAVNVWPLLIYRWPDILGVLCALGALLAIVMLWRSARRKQLVGKPHCRKCGYCLEGCPSERCPECGSLDGVRRAIIGRSVSRRVLPGAIAVALLLAMGAYLWTGSFPRTGSVAGWFEWWSTDALSWAKRHGFKEIAQKGCDYNRIIEINATTGERVRTLATCGGAPRRVCGLSPDGTVLFVDGIFDKPAMIRVDSGQIAHTLSCDDPDPNFPNSEWFVGLSDDGRAAYGRMIGDQDGTNKTQFIAYSLTSGKGEVVFETDVDPAPPNGITVRNLYVIRGPVPRALECPRTNPPGLIPDMLLRDLTHGGEVVRAIPTPPLALSRPVFTRDGRTMYRAAWQPADPDCPDRECLRAWDLETGTVTGRLDAPAASDKSQRVLDYDPERERLFVAMYREPDPKQPGYLTAILVADARNWQWVGRLLFPEASRWFVRSLAVSPDGRTLAASCVDLKGRYTLLFWDPSVLDEQADSPREVPTQQVGAGE